MFVFLSDVQTAKLYFSTKPGSWDSSSSIYFTYFFLKIRRNIYNIIKHLTANAQRLIVRYILHA
jgi:hypothetical protein